MKKIAFISTQAFSLINFRGSLIESLIREGIKVYALAPDFNEDLRNQLRAIGAEPIDISFSRAGLNPLRDVVDTFRLAFILARLKPDVTFGYFIKPVIFGTFAAYLARVPYRVAMIEGLGYVFTDNGKVFSWNRRLLLLGATFLYRAALKKTDTVFFLNTSDISDFVSMGLVSIEKAICIGGIGVDLEVWSESPPIFQPVTFILVARLLREKGIEYFVEAAMQVKKTYPHARFVLLGDLDSNPGSMRKEDVQNWVNNGIVDWYGHVSVKPWMEKASVFVLPSFREGVPRSTQEAMAMGRPVITTDVPGCRDTVVDGVNGFLVPVRNSGALAEAMVRFIENPNLIETMGRESRRLAVERFDVHRINTTIRGLLFFKGPSGRSG